MSLKELLVIYLMIGLLYTAIEIWIRTHALKNLQTEFPDLEEIVEMGIMETIISAIRSTLAWPSYILEWIVIFL